MTSRSQIPVAVPRQRPALFFVDNVGFDINIFQSLPIKTSIKASCLGTGRGGGNFQECQQKSKNCFKHPLGTFCFFRAGDGEQADL